MQMAPAVLVLEGGRTVCTGTMVESSTCTREKPARTFCSVADGHRADMLALLLASGHAWTMSRPMAVRAGTHHTTVTSPATFASAQTLRPALSMSVEAAAAGGSTRTTSEELIPREVLFGNPEYASPSISPDGKARD